MRVIVLLLVCLLGSCATTPGGVGANNTICCPGSALNTFELEADDNVPGFLKQLMLSNLSTVMAIKGFQPVSDGADLQVTLSYRQDDLSSGESHDDFDEHLSAGSDARFVARIVVTMDDKAGDRVFEGSVQRIHQVSPGEFMHTGKASESIFKAFSEMLAELPDRSPI